MCEILFLFLAVLIAVIIGGLVSYALVMDGVAKIVESLENEKQATSDGCEFCNDTLKRLPSIHAVSGYIEDDIVYEPNFCPMCGRRLEEV